MDEEPLIKPSLYSETIKVSISKSNLDVIKPLIESREIGYWTQLSLDEIFTSYPKEAKDIVLYLLSQLNP